MDEPQKRSLTQELIAFWPSLPFMAFGIWAAWTSLAYSGALWLSDSEVDGTYLSQMYIWSTIACGLTFVIAGVRSNFSRGFGRIVEERDFLRTFGLVAALGCFVIIAIGPFYLGALFPQLVNRILFFAGSIASGVGTAVIGLRCGQLFGMLPPRRVLIYASLSQFVACFIYLVVQTCPKWGPVEHGPSLVGICAFVLPPLVAAWLAGLQPTKAAGIIEESAPASGTMSKLPSAFWGFVTFTFVVSFVAAMIRANVVTTHALASTLEGNNMLILLRALFAGLLVVYAVSLSADGGRLGRICSLVTVFLATVIAAAAAFGGLSNELSLVVYFASSVIELLTWCLAAFIVAQKRVSAVTVFGIGRGSFILGAGLGWLVGTFLLPSLPQGTVSTVFFVVLAGVMLLLAMGIFSERDYIRLFSQVDEDELSLDDLFDIERREAALAAERRAEKRGRFSLAIEAIAEKHNLSSRETEVLRCLAMGHGSDRVAQTIGVKVNTVRTHTHNIYAKLYVHSREELMKLVDDTISQL